MSSNQPPASPSASPQRKRIKRAPSPTDIIGCPADEYIDQGCVHDRLRGMTGIDPDAGLLEIYNQLKGKVEAIGALCSEVIKKIVAAKYNTSVYISSPLFPAGFVEGYFKGIPDGALRELLLAIREFLIELGAEWAECQREDSHEEGCYNLAEEMLSVDNQLCSDIVNMRVAEHLIMDFSN